jgi:hypothetical protein
VSQFGVLLQYRFTGEFCDGDVVHDDDGGA